MKYITVSGIDRAGKTTLIKGFLEATKYKDYIVDRDPSNIFALNLIQDRFDDEVQSNIDFSIFIEKHKYAVDLAVLLVAEVNDLEKRFIDTDEPTLVGDVSMSDHQEIIRDMFLLVDYPETLVIDTSKVNPEEAVKMLVNKIQELYNADK